MSYQLHINTALENAYVAVSLGPEILAAEQNSVQKEHGSFLQPAIKSILQKAGLNLNDLSAVSVVNGPGSYTGLRVGLAAAKGICYSLDKPLICISTLEWLAHPFAGIMTEIICPMIDARRMEVFTAMYDASLKLVMPPQAMILDENSFPEIGSNRMVFTGNGRNKLPARVLDHPNCVSPTKEADFSNHAIMANMLYGSRSFSNLAYTTPFYLKPFHTIVKKN